MSIVERSFLDRTVAEQLPVTAKFLAEWNRETLPEESVFAALAIEFKAARENRTIGQIGARLNRIESGARSLVNKTGRTIRRIDNAEDWTAIFVDIDARWGELEIWRAIRIATQPVTFRHYLQAMDLERTATGEVVRVEPERRIYITLFARTFYVSFAVTLFCFVLGYPMAYAIAHSPPRWSRVLLVLVLLPFWTSLLVRTTTWIVLLQNQGVINDLLVAVGFISDEGRIAMIHNLTGSLVAMTQVLLPFMILPLYATMSGIAPSYMRAAASLGANPLQALVKIYWPLTRPGVAAGCLLVFILSIGYYITPALVGGQSGQLISNMIAYHLQVSLNWSLAAAIAVILGILVVILYVLYDRFVGVDKLKMT